VTLFRLLCKYRSNVSSIQASARCDMNYAGAWWNLRYQSQTPLFGTLFTFDRVLGVHVLLTMYVSTDLIKIYCLNVPCEALEDIHLDRKHPARHAFALHVSQPNSRLVKYRRAQVRHDVHFLCPIHTESFGLLSHRAGDHLQRSNLLVDLVRLLLNVARNGSFQPWLIFRCIVDEIVSARIYNT
jgi:hypothetical protein